MTEARETITYEELYQRTNALVERIEKAASKSTLVLMIASDTVHQGWLYSGTKAGIDQAEAELLERIGNWSDNGRMRNAGRRMDRLLQRFEENREAIAAGRRPPHKIKPPRQRRKRSAAK